MSRVLTCLSPYATWDRATRGLLGAAQRLAQDSTADHAALVMNSPGNSWYDELAKFCDRVVLVDAPAELADQPERWLAILQATCAREGPEFILLGSDVLSQEIAPRLAHRLQGSSVLDAVTIQIVGDRLHATRPVYGGKAVATIRLNRAPAVVSLRARSFAPCEPRPTPGSVDRMAAESTPALVAFPRIVERHQEGTGTARLEDARVIVAGGRGLGGPQPFDSLRQLAQLLGGELAASRAPCDSGWVAPNLQLGQTGHKVAPDLYLAVGISGASQHMMGVSDAKVIAAINTDPEAAIFRHARFGLVEDFRKVIGPLGTQLEKLLS